MKIKSVSTIFLLIVVVTVGCQSKSKGQTTEEKSENLENQEESMENGEKPFENLIAEDIKKVGMSTSTEEVFLTEEEIEEFAELLNQIVIYEEKEPEPLSGWGQDFKIKYSDSSLLEVTNNGNLYFIIDGVWYETEEEYIHRLGRFAERILGMTYP